MKVLLVEDNERVSSFVKKGLTEAGHTIDHADNGRDGMFLAAGETYDAIVMDRMLPVDIDGLGIIAALRKTGSRTPILILSALSDVDERIRGLQSGGDDYLVKPFAFGELLARLDALVRRAQGANSETTLVVDDLAMDLLSRRVTRAGRNVTLQPREFKLLEYLMRHANQVVTRTMLLENIWDYHFDPQTNVVDVHVSKLRQKIDVAAERPLLVAQATSNLIDNALKYGQKNGTIAVMATQRADKAIEIAVSDDGPGIPDGEKRKVTDRFYRADASRGTPGVGLGLSLVAAVAKLHGGSLTLSDNHPGLRATLILMPVTITRKAAATGPLAVTAGP
jgi:two-component system OmpR family response regulator